MLRYDPMKTVSCGPGWWRDAAAYAWVVLVLCGVAERQVAAADFNVASPGMRVEADSLEADEIGIRLLALNDAAGISVERLGARLLPHVAETGEVLVRRSHTVHACRAPPGALHVLIDPQLQFDQAAAGDRRPAPGRMQ